MKILAGIVGGLIVAILAMMLAGLAFGAGGGFKAGPVLFFVVWAACLAWAVKSPTAGKSWRRLLITSGVLSFLLPLSGIVFTGSYMASKEMSGAEAAGAAVGGTLVSGVLGFVGFFLGVVFLIIGLLVGRDKQIVYVNQQAPQSSEGG